MPVLQSPGGVVVEVSEATAARLGAEWKPVGGEPEPEKPARRTRGQ